DIHDTEGERFLYLPSVFCCWLIVEAIWRLSSFPRYSTTLIACTIIFHAYFFYKAADSYRYASYVTKSFIHHVHTAPAAQHLIAVSLPSQYKGALIFRKGLPQAVNWLVPDKFNTISVVAT